MQKPANTRHNASLGETRHSAQAAGILGKLDRDRWHEVKRDTLASIVRIPWQAGQTYNLTPQEEAS